VIEDFERCYRAVQSRDERFDGWFFTGVTSTGIYCRPSCPALTPKPENVRFFPTSAAAQQAGFRACLRCRPDAAPGSPEWDMRADVAARAMKLILDGAVEREGVSGLAARLGYSDRQLHRVLVNEVGAGPLAIARAQRAQTARLLLQSTDLPVSTIAFAAGFSSIRQFNDTIREVFARTPTVLRTQWRKSHGGPGSPSATETAPTAGAASPPAVRLRLAHRRPFAAGPLFEFLALRAVPGLEAGDATHYARALRLPHGDGTVELSADADGLHGIFRLQDLRDLTAAVARCRRLLDLDADPVAVDAALGADRTLRPLVRATPGRRVPGTVDGFELAVRAVAGQQVSVAGARTVVAALVAIAGSALTTPLTTPAGAVTLCFPDPETLAELAAGAPGAFAMPAARRRALGALSDAVAGGTIAIDPGADAAELTARLEALPGVGAWTSSYVALRALGDPDAFMPTDLGVRRAAAALGCDDAPRDLLARAERWRPWRAYAMSHLWALPIDTPITNRKTKGYRAA
jgi:AraC family transcriptional regulator of adaptative response / DNA-3-methyladenine glycosylase II